MYLYVNWYIVSMLIGTCIAVLIGICISMLIGTCASMLIGTCIYVNWYMYLC